MSYLGYSVYISTFPQQKAFLATLKNKETYIFTSLHIAEEMNEAYVQQATDMLVWLNEQGFKVIGDVSKRTLELFKEADIVKLARRLELYMIRIDYGFNDEEMMALAKSFPIVFNASTVDSALAQKLKQVSKDIFAIHNYYPREYTGLSSKQFTAINQRLQQEFIQVFGFIPNHKKSRGPIYQGLPTVESERYLPTAVSYFEMSLGMAMDNILLSDLALEPLDQQMIEVYETTHIVSLPCMLEKSFESLYEQVFTIRIDSPECAYRLQESREFATQ
ncbi:MAG: MupG family TIM beta-alpha barrel fold protein, partial [Niameybacter sp.]